MVEAILFDMLQHQDSEVVTALYAKISPFFEKETPEASANNNEDQEADEFFQFCCLWSLVICFEIGLTNFKIFFGLSLINSVYWISIGNWNIFQASVDGVDSLGVSSLDQSLKQNSLLVDCVWITRKQGAETKIYL
ncbi:unnamed protein product [Lactuca saligna]|uniref:Uncharacterized protein n=1 Tax=Lactuca saligna TaxID=75948 RepID=A0AA35YM11_LACSI|nr:unnamed protein product [Lactuca saligna]